MTNLFLLMGTPQGGSQGNSMISTLIFFALIFFIFYFMILRPQQKRNKERQKLLDSIKKGDRVITSSGLHAKIVNVDEKTVLLEAGDGLKLKYERSAIAAVIKESTE
jgi:preprotein translocase subunit YajC